MTCPADFPRRGFLVTGAAHRSDVDKQDSHVKTVISRADGARIKAAWRLRTGPAGPKVIDVEDTHEVIATVRRFKPDSAVA